MSIFEGLFVGIGTIVFVGPVFFTLLQIAIDKGTKAGLSVAAGIIFSDIVIIALLFWGINKWIEDPIIQTWLAGIGSVILIGLGLKHLFRPNDPVKAKSFPAVIQNAGSFIKGFLVNFVNPFVFFIWISIMAYGDTSFQSELESSLFLLGVLIGIFSTDALKAIFASRLKGILKPSILKKLFLLIGLILIAFGLRLVYFIAMQP